MLINNKIRSKLLIALSLTCVIASACNSNRDDTATPVLSGPPQTTFPMPPVNVTADMGWITSDNKRARVGDYAGQVLVLDFYATWCAPCRESIPELKSLQREFEKNGLIVIGLNVGGAEDRVKVPAFAQELAITYRLGFPDKALTDLFFSDDQTIPQTFVFDRDGKLVKRIIGYDAGKSSEFKQTLESALGRTKQQTANGGN